MGIHSPSRRVVRILRTRGTGIFCLEHKAASWAARFSRFQVRCGTVRVFGVTNSVGVKMRTGTPGRGFGDINWESSEQVNAGGWISFGGWRLLGVLHGVIQ